MNTHRCDAVFLQYLSYRTAVCCCAYAAWSRSRLSASSQLESHCSVCLAPLPAAAMLTLRAVGSSARAAARALCAAPSSLAASSLPVAWAAATAVSVRSLSQSSLRFAQPAAVAASAVSVTAVSPAPAAPADPTETAESTVPPPAAAADPAAPAEPVVAAEPVESVEYVESSEPAEEPVARGKKIKKLSMNQYLKPSVPRWAERPNPQIISLGNLQSLPKKRVRGSKKQGAPLRAWMREGDRCLIVLALLCVCSLSGSPLRSRSFQWSR